VVTGIKMVLVFALLGGTLWFLRRHDRSSLVSARRGERPVALLAQAKVGKTSSVALVRIGTESYAVGVTEQRVTLLVDHPIELANPDDSADAADAIDADSAPVSAPPATLGGVLRNLVGLRPRVHYLDVTLPVQTRPQDRATSGACSSTALGARSSTAWGAHSPGTDGYGSGPTARTPEPVRRR
jgi:flagellar biogenesis protein FliO